MLSALSPAPSRAARPAILLVEDEDLVRTMLAEYLSAFAYRVLIAASAVAAVPLWRAHRDEIGILITDVVMPGGMNGLELATVLESDKPSLQVIVTTGYQAEHTVTQTGTRRVLSKPYSPAEVVKLVQESFDSQAPAHSPTANAQALTA